MLWLLQLVGTKELFLVEKKKKIFVHTCQFHSRVQYILVMTNDIAKKGEENVK